MSLSALPEDILKPLILSLDYRSMCSLFCASKYFNTYDSAKIWKARAHKIINVFQSKPPQGWKGWTKKPTEVRVDLPGQPHFQMGAIDWTERTISIHFYDYTFITKILRVIEGSLTCILPEDLPRSLYFKGLDGQIKVIGPIMMEGFDHEKTYNSLLENPSHLHFSATKKQEFCVYSY